MDAIGIEGRERRLGRIRALQIEARFKPPMAHHKLAAGEGRR
jgi:hypothetical protein